MKNLEELQALYEKAIKAEDEYRRMIYVPATNKLSSLYSSRMAIWEEIDEIKLSYFKKEAGDFISADLSKLDMEWFLSAKNIGIMASQYRNRIFEKLPLKQAYYYNTEADQIILMVKVSSRADIADIEEIAEWIEKFLPYLKPYNQYKYYFEIMECSSYEYERIIFYSQDGKRWCIKNDYGNQDNEKEGSLRTMLEYIRISYPYEN